MPVNYTPLTNGQDAVAATFNAPLTQLDDALELLKLASLHVFQARLTPSTSNPTYLTDALAASAVYLLPHKGRTIALPSGSSHAFFTLPDEGYTISLAGLASNNYDIFFYNDDGTLTHYLVAWTNNTARATAIVKPETLGYYVLSTDHRLRYAGSVILYATGLYHSAVFFRGLWNYYNRIEMPFLFSGTAGHTYVTPAWRSWNNDGANHRGYMNFGVSEEAIPIRIAAHITGVTSNGSVMVNIGHNSTSVAAVGSEAILLGNAEQNVARGDGHIIPTVGLNNIDALEYGAATSPTFNGYRVNAGYKG